MEILKKHSGVKIGLFVLLQIFVVVTLLTGTVVIENLGHGWYLKNGREVERELIQETGSRAAQIISDRLYEEGDSDRAADEGEELVYGERESSGFGYHVYLGKDAGNNDIFIFGVKGAQGGTIAEFCREISEDDRVHTVKEDHGTYVIEVYIDPETGKLPGEIQQRYKWLEGVYKYRSYALFGGIVGGAAAVVILILLLVTAGSRKREEPDIVEKLPADLLAVIGFWLVALIGVFAADLMELEHIDIQLMVFITGAILISVIITGFLMLLATQAKRKQWWKSTVIYRIYRFLGKSVAALCHSAAKQIPLVWKTAVCLIFIWILNLFFATGMYYGGLAAFLWFAEAAAVSAGVLYIALGLRRLKEGGKRLAEGDFDYKINKNGLHLELAEHAENLNSIGNGMAKAVEERIKSERFKAELITNVSHDIKTPLTSIINYVDFLKQEELGSEKAKEYLEVLERQSNRLKKLTEDLVDASKAATGNIKMELAPCQIGVLMEQTVGEYEKKAKESGLDFIMTLPEEEMEIQADGRRLWRVFDNLLNNICKYSQPGSRVYMELEKQDDRAVITYKNMSRYKLNITEEELMERFVRGDSSRHTEGSGLGLSIARNLVGLQGGTFQIKIDGDLFKVIMEFPLSKLQGKQKTR